jgi:hypothetical protein
MKRERLLTQLIRLRELHLKSQSAQLKIRAQHLSEVRERHDQARSGAAKSLDDSATLADLAHFGRQRIINAKLAVQVEIEVRALSEKVGHARRLTDSAREAHAELRRAHLSETERSLETEAEHFFSWKKDHRR